MKYLTTHTEDPLGLVILEEKDLSRIGEEKAYLSLYLLKNAVEALERVGISSVEVVTITAMTEGCGRGLLLRPPIVNGAVSDLAYLIAPKDYNNVGQKTEGAP